MAPIELNFGKLGNDGEGHDFFINQKTKLPLRIKPGKRVRKEIKEGNVTFSVEASCDKNDLGGTLLVRYNEYVRRIDAYTIEYKRTDASKTVGLGGIAVLKTHGNWAASIKHVTEKK